MVGLPSGSLSEYVSAPSWGESGCASDVHAVADHPSKPSISVRVAEFALGIPLVHPPLLPPDEPPPEEDFVQHWTSVGPGQRFGVLVPPPLLQALVGTQRPETPLAVQGP
jgi:hypothetical protein